jgi:hypothetical protein
MSFAWLTVNVSDRMQATTERRTDDSRESRHVGVAGEYDGLVAYQPNVRQSSGCAPTAWLTR